MKSEDSNSAKRFVVRGRVQGVGYRFFVEKHAQRMGLRGYAKNLGDGTVEVVAYGASSAIQELEGLLRIGPRLALVSGVETETAPSGDYTQFRVRV
ncbi:MAG: acylphosphatase [Bryobacterales bacterium]|nr:acylphosphatase [Bryobacterales bacterium]